MVKVQSVRASAIVALVALVTMGLVHNVPKQLTEEDVAFIRLMMMNRGGRTGRSRRPLRRNWT